MSRRPAIILMVALATGGASRGEESLGLSGPWSGSLPPGRSSWLALPALEPGATYALEAALLEGDLSEGEEVLAEVRFPGGGRMQKTLHAGDPGLQVPFRVPVAGAAAGAAGMTLSRNPAGAARPIASLARLVRLGGPEDAARFEAEPNDSHREANPLRIGVDVEGSADDVEYLDHRDEGKKGLDWFRFEIEGAEPSLVIFEIDLLDRDVSANLRVHAPLAGGEGVAPYLEGKDPMEIVHDRERERYSKAITRVFPAGVYFLEVNANHPRYLIRSHRYPVPPYRDPRLAVEVGARYIMDVGDAWFAQVPRAGDIYRRAQNMHETSTRCTACHPSVFSTEANLTAHRNGYPIGARSNFRYVVERLYYSITPFYGPDGFWWQRFIAIPLQSQGKQGGILIDFERQVSGRETDIVLRFGPLLRAAWATRDRLPADEENGVVPADSKFGFAWRDWRVLRECHRRTGDESYARAADRLREVFTSPESEKRIETLQDRMHLVLGLATMDREAYRERIEREVGRLLALQNPDGGWHEEGKPDRPGAEYTTGQMLHTLLEAGRRPSEPAMEKGLSWLLSRQEPFGGWYQTDTHENFRTPMRETRYAVMALSTAYPRGKPLQGMGNEDGGPVRAPGEGGSVADLLEDLEGLWEASSSSAPRIELAILRLLERPEAPLRAAAASALGRIGGKESVGPLLARLSDPSKAVWRAAAWALRRLGNQGLAADALRGALESADPLTRRGAARAFAYQFQEMDGRADIARSLVRLASDPDLLTRLQALRTLRQWWYRTEDRGLRDLIVKTCLERMAVPETAVVRKNLSENLYILLDENHSGGVSIQRNIRDLPAEMAERVLEGRRAVEREVLLPPVLAGLAAGNRLQREALLAGFDGSFFKGRSYARNPRAMIDVGNDREFGFLEDPAQGLLESTLGSLLVREREPSLLGQGMKLASFFHLPARSSVEAVQGAFLDALASEAGELQAGAREIVGRELVLRKASGERVLERAARLLAEGGPGVRTALLSALGRSPEALESELIREAVRKALLRETAGGKPSSDFLPLVGTPVLDDREALRAIEASWKALSERPAAERIPVLEAAVKRPGLLGAKPPREAIRLLEEAATDPEVAVREKLFALLGSLEALSRSSAAAGILYAGLSDESPAIRSRSLALARENDAVWREEDVHEYVLKLLVDADPKIRDSALRTVAERRLLSSERRYAPRLKALREGDPALRERAEEALRAAGLDPAQVEADAEVSAPRLPDVLLFRDRVNRYFYRKGEDRNACADCHATHTILGLAEPPGDGRPLSDGEVIGNYRSILKVINTGDPEQSLVLRKPRSPYGTGQASGDSPTGLTHVGGTRWTEGTANEAYQAILAFIRSARSAGAPLRRSASADSYSPAYPPALAADGNPDTLWHTEFVGAMPGHPHELVLDLESARAVAGVTYLPRRDSSNGRVKDYEVYLSADGKEWGNPLARGAWSNDALPKIVFLPRTLARFVKLRGLSEVSGLPYMSAAEVEPILSPETGAAPARKGL